MMWQNYMKKIGIDARFYSPSATGIGRHVFEVVQQLGSLDKENQYVVFLRPEQVESFRIANKNFKTEVTKAPHYSFAEQTLFLKQLNKHRFDLMIFPQFNVPIGYKRKFMVTIHDLTIHFFPGKKSNFIKHSLYKYIIRNAAKKAAAVMAVSENTKKDIQKYLNVSANKIVVVGNGVSQTFQKESNRTNLDKFKAQYKLPKQYFLYTGVLRTHKNILGLIEAFSIFHKQNKSTELVIAGPKDDLYFPEIKTLAQKKGLGKIVHFTGFFPEKDFGKLFSAARAFVFPSFYEGFGIPPLEAMSVGVPTMVAKSSSLPEVCGDASLYFDPYDWKDIAQKMVEILNPQVQKVLIAKGEKQWRIFSWDRVGAVYFDCIKGLL